MSLQVSRKTPHVGNGGSAAPTYLGAEGTGSIAHPFFAHKSTVPVSGTQKPATCG